MNSDPSLCPQHGRPKHRDWCARCNAAYMRDYMRRRRVEMPTHPLFERARKRAYSRGIQFTITRNDIVIPETCPVLGIPLTIGGKRSPSSPSLDRIEPVAGYVPGNIRVISDRANRLKGARPLEALQRLAQCGTETLRADYRLVSDYVAREELLREVRSRAAHSKRDSALMKRLLPTLDRIFSVGLVSLAEPS